MSEKDFQNNYSLMKWIVQVGFDSDESADGFKKVIDTVVSVLVNSHNDKEILPVICKMIFTRAKNGHHFHDLAWALFRSSDTYVLRLIAEYLDSVNAVEAELAHKLLGFNEYTVSKKDYVSWLEQNHPQIEFTGQGFQYSSHPIKYGFRGGNS